MIYVNNDGSQIDLSQAIDVNNNVSIESNNDININIEGTNTSINSGSGKPNLNNIDIDILNNIENNISNENLINSIITMPRPNVNPFPDKMEPSVVASGDNVIDQFVDYDKIGDDEDGGVQKCCGFYPDRKPCKW